MRLIKSAAFQLTLWYLGIIMLLSALFSGAIYRLSMDQLIETTDRQRAAVQRLLLPPQFETRRTEYTQALDDQLDTSRGHLLLRLGLLNLITLLLGGAAAYALARRTLRPIQDSLEAQSRFTADASHELRTPLTAMRSEIEVALRAGHLNAADARTLLGSNLEEIAKLESLSASLLRLARFENGLDTATLTKVPVAALFEGAIDRHQAAIADRRVQLEVHHGPETLQGDRPALIELLAVLLDNAIKYSPAGSTVTLTSKPVGNFIHLSVADVGAGIKASDIPHIFDRFYRADRSRNKEEVTGYGLGLSIAKRIAGLHHGVITVDSTPGQGSTFRVKLPVDYMRKQSFLGLP
jgi:two-component system, OmpR family, sensor histidine kinase CiaH